MVQLFFIRSLRHYYAKIFANLDPKIETVICDRYLTSAEVFINTLLDQSLITTFDREVLLETLKDYVAPLPKPDGVIYLKRTPEYCVDKIKERNRSLDIAMTELSQQKTTSSLGNVAVFTANTIKGLLDSLN